jgi:ADP-dependent phosphofructokinase/glucokinase
MSPDNHALLVNITFWRTKSVAVRKSGHLEPREEEKIVEFINVLKGKKISAPYEEIRDELFLLYWEIAWFAKSDKIAKELAGKFPDLLPVLIKILALEETGFLCGQNKPGFILIWNDVAGKLEIEQSAGSSLTGADQEKLNKLNDSLEKVKTKIYEYLKQYFPNVSINDIQNTLRAVIQERYYSYDFFPSPEFEGENIAEAYKTLLHIWRSRFWLNERYLPTGKKYLLTFSSTLDYSVRLTTQWVNQVMDAAALAEHKTCDQLTHELGDYLWEARLKKKANSGSIKTSSDFLKTILGYIEVTNAGEKGKSKVEIDKSLPIQEKWDLMDWIAKVTNLAGATVSFGGAAVTGAHALSTLGETEVSLMIPFVSQALIDILKAKLGNKSDKLHMLWYRGKQPNYSLDKTSLNKFKAPGEQPERHNTVVEFSKGSMIVYCPCCGARVMPGHSDRIAFMNTYAYYIAGAYTIDRAKSWHNADSMKVRSLFGFDSVLRLPKTKGFSDADCYKFAEQAAKDVDLLIIAGLQNFEDAYSQNTVMGEIEKFRHVHTEISSSKNFGFPVDLIQKGHIQSIGIGEELDDLYEKYVPKEQRNLIDAQNSKACQQIMKSLSVAKFLHLPRLYWHGLEFDIIVRQGNLDMHERMKEIRADVVAKWAVLRKLMEWGMVVPNSTRDPMTSASNEGLKTMAELENEFQACFNLQEPVSQYGAYFQEYDRTVILVPVRCVYGPLQDLLRIIGAGDTTSTISAAKIVAEM